MVGIRGQVAVLAPLRSCPGPRNLAGFSSGFRGVHRDGSKPEKQAFEYAFHSDAVKMIGVGQTALLVKVGGVTVVASGGARSASPRVS